MINLFSLKIPLRENCLSLSQDLGKLGGNCSDSAENSLSIFQHVEVLSRVLGEGLRSKCTLAHLCKAVARSHWPAQVSPAMQRLGEAMTHCVQLFNEDRTLLIPILLRKERFLRSYVCSIRMEFNTLAFSTHP